MMKRRGVVVEPSRQESNDGRSVHGEKAVCETFPHASITMYAKDYLVQYAGIEFFSFSSDGVFCSFLPSPAGRSSFVGTGPPSGRFASTRPPVVVIVPHRRPALYSCETNRPSFFWCVWKTARRRALFAR